MKSFVGLIFVIFALTGVALGQVRTDAAEANKIAERFQKPEHLNLLQGAVWTVTHDYSDIKKMSTAVESVFKFLDAFQKHQSGDPAPLEQIGGVSAFKAELSKFMVDEDQALRAFAAVLVGITGDKGMYPQLVKLIETPTDAKDQMMRYDRGRALQALGLLGAIDQKLLIARFIRSESQYDRSGAIWALTTIDAKEFAKDIAGLLDRADLEYDDDTSPIYFLIETGTAVNFKSSLVKAMRNRFNSEPSIAAMYALAHIDAKEHAKDIAFFLDHEFRKADAAKALAILGASQYGPRIAALLDDESGLVRSAAALSLGILNEKQHSNRISRQLNGPESSVQAFAATALFLLGAEDHLPRAWPFLKIGYANKSFVTESSFSPIVATRFDILTKRLVAALDSFNQQQEPE